MHRRTILLGKKSRCSDKREGREEDPKPLARRNAASDGEKSCGRGKRTTCRIICTQTRGESEESNLGKASPIFDGEGEQLRDKGKAGKMAGEVTKTVLFFQNTQKVKTMVLPCGGKGAKEKIPNAVSWGS